MKLIAVTQARVGSTRLPGKVLKKIGEKSLLDIHFNRILESKRISKLVVATTLEDSAVQICDAATKAGIGCFQGSTDDVLDRFYKAASPEAPDYVIRLTSDCPLIDAELIDKCIDFTLRENLDYVSNSMEPTYPDGQDIEVFTFKALHDAWEKATLSSEREHVTPYIWKNGTVKGGTLFKSANFSEGFSFGHLRMTVDEPEDFELIKNLIERLGIHKSWLEYATFLDEHPEIKSINSTIGRNEGYQKSLNKDKSK